MGCAESEPLEEKHKNNTHVNKQKIYKTYTKVNLQNQQKKIESRSNAQFKSQNKGNNLIGVYDDKTSAYGLLICGTGESGKTTFARQLRLRFLNGFSDSERKSFVPTIRGNLIETMQLFFAYMNRNSMELDPEFNPIKEEIENVNPFDCEFSELANGLKALWENKTIQEVFEHRDETSIPDHMDYFFAKIDELVDDNYLPTDDDILRARIRTIGIDQVTFKTEDAYIRIYDVGGQKNERVKWEKVMREVAGCIFCISFADFDKYMFEDENALRIMDSLSTFAQLVRKEKFSASPFFLLCNKFDSFSEKIRNKNNKFKQAFPDYKGDPHNPETVAKFLIDKFIEKTLPENPQRPIIYYRLVALDQDNAAEIAQDICKFIYDRYYKNKE